MLCDSLSTARAVTVPQRKRSTLPMPASRYATAWRYAPEPDTEKIIQPCDWPIPRKSVATRVYKLRQFAQRGESLAGLFVFGTQFHAVVLLDHQCNFECVDGIQSQSFCMITEQSCIGCDGCWIDAVEIQCLHQVL